jgi:hypothetical protein
VPSRGESSDLADPGDDQDRGVAPDTTDLGENRHAVVVFGSLVDLFAGGGDLAVKVVDGECDDARSVVRALLDRRVRAATGSLEWGSSGVAEKCNSGHVKACDSRLSAVSGSPPLRLGSRAVTSCLSDSMRFDSSSCSSRSGRVFLTIARPQASRPA